MIFQNFSWQSSPISVHIQMNWTYTKIEIHKTYGKTGLLYGTNQTALIIWWLWWGIWCYHLSIWGRHLKSLLLLLIIICVYAGTCKPQHRHEGQRTPVGSWLFPLFPLWIPGIKLTSLGLYGKCFYPQRHVVDPNLGF